MKDTKERTNLWMSFTSKVSINSLTVSTLTFPSSLWEGSWEDRAQLFDVENEVAYEPKKIRRIEHKGKYYQMSA